MDEFIRSIDIPWPKGVQAFQTLGRPSVLKPYGHFNLALHVEDSPELVLNNRKQLREHLHLDTEPQWLEQVHSNHVHITSNTHLSPPKADAAISKTPGQAVLVMTADCVPILLASSRHIEVAAVHAGWRGLANHIIANTLKQFRDDPKHVCAWIGPAISMDHYRVDMQRAHLLDPSGLLSLSDKKTHHGCNINLKHIAKTQLKDLGVEKIYIDPACTYTNSDYYSYRRQNITGRQASGILILS